MSKEHDYAYEAGYRDGSIHYELEHCPSCKNIADLQEALEENKRLRELVRDIYDSAAFWIDHFGDAYKLHKRMNELGVEVE